MTAFPFAGYIVAGIFLLAVATTIAGALIAALATRIIRAVAGLMVCCLGLAGLYYFLHSPFLALMEVLIYVGAVFVTIIFGVMLSEADEPAGAETRRGAVGWTSLAAFVGVLVFAALAGLVLPGQWPAAPATPVDGSVAAIGRALLTTYSFAFEAISLVIFTAILGALVIARGGRTRAPQQGAAAPPGGTTSLPSAAPPGQGGPGA